MKEFNYDVFFEKIGIKNGDKVDVVSDLLSIMANTRRKYLFDPNHLIDSLLAKVGKEGTVGIRCFNWDFCHGQGFSIKDTPSQVGSLGNIALERNDFKRTKHPIYSWMVWGKDSEYLTRIENQKSFGENTPWEYFCDNGIMLRIGKTSVSGFTYSHHAEQLEQVPYRFEKKFTGTYIDENGVETTREYSMFVRYLDYDINSDLYDDILNEMEQKGIYKYALYENVPISSFDIQNAVKLFRNDIKYNYGKRVCVINGEPGFEKIINNPPRIK